MAEQPKPFAEQVVAQLSTLRRFASKLLPGKSEHQDDLVQETIARALLYEANFQQGTNLKSWLFAIMQNLHRDQLRLGQSKPLDFVPPEDLNEAMDTTSLTPLELTVQQQDLQAVLDLIAQLPQQHRDIMLLVKDEESYRTIAEKLEMPLGTVMSTLHRVRVHVRRQLPDEHPFKVEDTRKGKGAGRKAKTPTNKDSGDKGR